MNAWKNSWRTRRTWLSWGILLAILPLASSVSVMAQDSRLQLTGQHIRLITDRSDKLELEEFVKTFDHAVGQWEAFWNLPAGTLDDWSVDAFVMKDVAGFRRDGSIGTAVPDFPYGYSFGNQVYVKSQPSAYYTRHLLLHEGVHAMMFDQFGGVGPVWFSEGTAEYLATHIGVGERAYVGIMPQHREDFPFWGRFKRIGQLRKSNQRARVETVMKYAPNLRGEIESYSWSWALVAMLSGYPEYKETLKQAAAHGLDSDQEFNRWFYGRLGDDWPQFQSRWHQFIEDLGYGYDDSRERIEVSKHDSVWNQQPLRITIDADRGWQSVGVRFRKGTQIRLSATGKVVLNDQPKPWMSHPEGVTIEYHNGQPLGRLLARFLPNVSAKSGFLPPLKTVNVGSEATIRFNEPAWLLLRVNDHLDGMGNNFGSYQVEVVSSAVSGQP